MSVAEERSTSREPLSDVDVRSLLASVSRVRIAQGRKIVEHDPADVRLDALKGRSGNYRAPLLKVGDALLVGFNESLLETL